MFSPFASKLIIEKKIRREYLNNLDKFDIQIFVFNSRGEPFEQFNLNESYHSLKARLSEYKTETEGLYFINQARGQATTRYMDFIEIKDRGQVIGYVLIDLRQKRLVPNSVFPLLLNENLDAQQIEGTEQYSYGVFIGKELQYNYGAFNYRKNLDAFVEHSDKLLEKGVKIQEYYHRAYLGDNNRFVIVSSKVPTLSSRFANFSFLFLIHIFTILLILFVVAFYQGARHVKLNYSAKIQLYLNFAFFAPLVIVSIVTVSIIIQTFKTSLESQYVEFAENLSTKISGPLNNYNQQEIEKEDLTDEIFQMAEVADLDLNVFSTNGALIGSSLYQIYQNDILSNYIEPRAYIKIIEESESAFVLEEQVGQLSFKNAYVGVRSYDTGEIIGILSLPFFASQRDLEHNIVEVLSNIINIFTFVFIIFLFVSFLVSRGLTFPLRLITQKIRRTTLSAFNEPLSWNSDDEIGLMVAEYNRMLVNLEHSKQALAKSEKESAWREMARQVAHEIKNPLTPMKLTLQHMKRVIDDEGSNEHSNDKKQKQINTLLEQIETLSDIATSFSDFAKMPTPQLELLDIGALLHETIDLYNNKELGHIQTNIAPGVHMVEGDRKWLGRAFSNLIINAFQAVKDDQKARVAIHLSTTARHRVHIEIIDNGSGIPAHIRDQVFTPNFSTKYTGSGLGLAITKKGIEHANGQIWFSSEEGVGTVFYIEIPLA
ncbi:MAG: HAMP domain-containing histidine kinase [Cyclobacteriaceae bacterium]|nr:HAMP domain-containing histidine kinase [Cyclobacteriaceae bacterium]